MQEPKAIVYVPNGAKLNIENKTQEPPETKYNNRRKIFNLDAIKKIIGGVYGRK
jgi:hypothetical protein